MAVTNIAISYQGAQAVVTWNADLTYSYVVLDGSLYVRTTEQTVSISRDGWDDIQIFDSNATDYDWESALAGRDPRRISITWNTLVTVSTDVENYRVFLDGSFVGAEIPEDGSSTYSYTSPSLADGEHTITVKGVDGAGNVSASSSFAFDIIGPPEPVSNIAVSQSGSPSQINISWNASPSF